MGKLDQFARWAKRMDGFLLEVEPGVGWIIPTRAWAIRGDTLAFQGTERFHAIRVKRARREGEGWRLDAIRVDYLDPAQLAAARAWAEGDGVELVEQGLAAHLDLVS